MSIFDNEINELKKLKRDNSEECISQWKLLEREVMFFFETFNEENTEQDSRVRERNKVLTDIISDQSKYGSKFETSYWEEYLCQTRPQLEKIVENVKSNWGNFIKILLFKILKVN